MKIFVAGATGVVGSRLVPLLVGAGHEVVGMSRSPERARGLERTGARGVAVDAYDRERLERVLTDERPEVVVDQLTDLPRELAPSGQAQFDANDRIRTEGAQNLMDAALASGARRFIAQSYAHIYAPKGDWVKSEHDDLNLGPDAPELRRRNVEAVRRLESIVLETPGIEGVALRYGAFYGPGTALAPDGSIARLVRERHYPIVGDGKGMTSFVHVDDAAAAVLPALDGPVGVYNICDDQPARMAQWVHFYARALGAPAPRHVPAVLVRALGREHFIFRSTEQRGASNAKARRVLGFDPHFTSWRTGFEATLEERVAA